METEQREQRIRERAYELYCHRHPGSGSAEDDWREAEGEIDREERRSEKYKGPARLKDRSHWGKLATRLGEDVENPA